MPIDVQKVLAADLEPICFEFTDRDVMLYGLGIGYGAEPVAAEHLRYVYENGLEVFPSFGVLPAADCLAPFLGLPGLDINPAMLVHGEHSLEVCTYPLPTFGKLTTTGRVEAIYDKGSAALAPVRSETRTEKGELLFINRASVFMRGEGGFGGEPGPPTGNAPPDRKPDHVVLHKTLPQQAILYRLGCESDRNPLHVDPNAAQYAGFRRPILHGLCSFGHMVRAVVEVVCQGRPQGFRSLQVRFVGELYPGETIRTLIWEEGAGKLLLQAESAERDTVIITNAVALINQ